MKRTYYVIYAADLPCAAVSRSRATANLTVTDALEARGVVKATLIEKTFMTLNEANEFLDGLRKNFF